MSSPLRALWLCSCLQEEHSQFAGSLAYQQCVQALTFRKAQLQVHQLQQLGFQEYQAIAAVQVSRSVQHSTMLTGTLTCTALGLAGGHPSCMLRPQACCSVGLAVHHAVSHVLGRALLITPAPCPSRHSQLGMAADTCWSCLQRWGDDVQNAVTWLLEGSVRSEQEAREVSHPHAARHMTCTSFTRSRRCVCHLCMMQLGSARPRRGQHSH